MSSDDEEKPPAPPLRLTSNRGSEAVSLPVDMRPLPKEPDLETSKSSFWLSSKKPKEVEKPNISYPSKFKHVVHVGFDPETGEFTGMPEAWARLLISSNISREMQMKNPQAVLDVLNYYEHSKQPPQDKFMTTNHHHGTQASPSPRPSYSLSNNNLRTPTPPVPPARHHHKVPPISTPKVPASSSGHSISSNSSSIKSTESGGKNNLEDDVKQLDIGSNVPPPIATRPEKTKSIYTAPVDEDENDPNALHVPALAKESTTTTSDTNSKPDETSSNKSSSRQNVKRKRK